MSGENATAQAAVLSGEAHDKLILAIRNAMDQAHDCRSRGDCPSCTKVYEAALEAADDYARAVIAAQPQAVTAASGRAVYEAWRGAIPDYLCNVPGGDWEDLPPAVRAAFDAIAAQEPGGDLAVTRSVGPDDVHVDWHMTPGEWRQLCTVFWEHQLDTPYIGRLIEAGAIPRLFHGSPPPERAAAPQATADPDSQQQYIDRLHDLIRDMLQSCPDTADEQEWRDRAGALHVHSTDGQPFRAYTEDDL